ncbi:hypothetical protein LRS13_09575 [Svornostia abyssi]|uniref:Uncharacterized protein n=1 Tax=Svornostia abyssi TaxID=2898438 RepID=A0ABY5PMB3_9ACTN|nr:hypothetical protein LRS13_09575 [Parviterribacteraceae bacterium J379]
MSPTTLPRASRWETLGAWLHVWTPPRDVEIPAPPSPRRLAVWAGAALVVLGIVLALTVPRIESAKDERSARASAAEAAEDAARRAEAIRVQRASFATSAPDDLDTQLRDARAAILADARARHAAGELPQPTREVTCSRAAGSARSDLLRFSCVAATARLADVAAGPQRTVGYPFSLVVQPETGRLAWCRTSQCPRRAQPATAACGCRSPPRARAPRRRQQADRGGELPVRG